MRILKASLVLQLALVAPTVSAQGAPTRDASSSGIVLPSETCRGIFIVPVTLGGDYGITADLLLDTGSSWTFLDPKVVRRILGRRVRPGKVSFAEARVGEHELGPLRARVYPMKTLGFALGHEIDGILGFPAFRKVLLTLDYPAREVRVESGSLPPPDGRQVFRDTGFKRPHLRVDLGGRRRELQLDSGATPGHFQVRPTDRLEWSVEPRPVTASVLFGGVVVHRGGRLRDAVRLGPLEFEAPIASLAGRELQVGWQVLRHFVLTFDQKKKRIRIASTVAGPVHTASRVGNGLATHPRPEGLEIVKVFAGTSAEVAGLRAGDLIVAIDGTTVHERGCRDPQGDPPGVRHLLSYLRDGVRGEVEVETEVLVP